jgi:YVTN family beta-propeller protein
MSTARIGIAVIALLTASTEVWSATPEDRARLVQTSGAHFSRPHDLVLAPDGRSLYVADMSNHVVKVLDPETLIVRGEIGRGELASPHDVTFDHKGRLLVADSGNDRVVIYTLAGLRADKAGELRDGLSSPEGVVARPNGRVYVTSAGAHTVTVFVDGKRTRHAGGRGSGRSEFIRPHDIDLGPEGLLYVADPGNNRLQVLDDELRAVDMLEGHGYMFHEPKYLAFDERGWLYVADEHNHQVKIFDRERRRLVTIGSGRRGAGEGELNQPEGVTARDGRVWIADTYNNRILLFRLEGALR